MITKEQITDIVYESIDELNDVNGMSIGKQLQTPLMGENSDLDSIDFVMLVISIENKLDMNYGVVVSITAEKSMSQKRSPFKNVETLIDYIEELTR